MAVSSVQRLRDLERENAELKKMGAEQALDLLPRFARVLGVTTDALLGDTKRKAEKKASNRDSRLWRRFAQIEKLSPADRKPIIQVLDAFLAKAKLTTDDERRV